jgi:hypothetical protein
MLWFSSSARCFGARGGPLGRNARQVDAALGLVQPGPAAGPGIAPGRNLVRAGHAADRQEPVGDKRVARQVAALEFRLDFLGASQLASGLILSLPSSASINGRAARLLL